MFLQLRDWVIESKSLNPSVLPPRSPSLTGIMAFFLPFEGIGASLITKSRLVWIPDTSLMVVEIYELSYPSIGLAVIAWFCRWFSGSLFFSELSLWSNDNFGEVWREVELSRPPFKLKMESWWCFYELPYICNANEFSYDSYPCSYWNWQPVYLFFF